MKNHIKTVVSATLQLIANTSQHEGTPSPQEVKEYLAIAEGLCAGYPGFKDCDYEFKDFSKKQDGSQMRHVLTASFYNKPELYAVGEDISWTIVKFASSLYSPCQIITEESKRLDWPELSQTA